MVQFCHSATLRVTESVSFTCLPAIMVVTFPETETYFLSVIHNLLYDELRLIAPSTL